MAGNDIKLKNAELTFQGVPVERLLVRTVSKNNKTSGKITLPSSLVDKKVYIVIPK